MGPTKPFLGLEGGALSWAISLTSASAFLLFGKAAQYIRSPNNSDHTQGYDQGIMGSILATPYFLEAINIEVSVEESKMTDC